MNIVIKIAFFIIIFTTTCMNNDRVKKHFDGYFESLNNHDLEKTLSFFSDDYELLFSGREHIIDKSAMVDILGWDKGTNGTVSYSKLQYEGQTVTGQFTEQNEFLKLIGIEELKSEITYIFNDSGLIEQQTYRLLPGQPLIQKKLQPAIKWAKKHRPEELDEIYPDNQIIYNEDMSIRWVNLLRDWRDQVEE